MSGPSRGRAVAAGLMLLVTSAASHWPMWHVGFLSDDYAFLAESNVQSGGIAGFFRPIPGWLFGLEHAAFGMRPAPFFAVTLLLHALCCWLGWWLALELGASAGWALAAALLFSAAPVHAEAVYWIVCQNYLIEGVFTLLALLCFSSYLRRPRQATYLMAAAAVVLALGTRESAVLVPVFLLARDVARGGDLRPAALARRHALFALTVALYVGNLLLRAERGLGSGYRYRFGWHVARNSLHFVLATVTLQPFDLSWPLPARALPTVLLALSALALMLVVGGRGALLALVFFWLAVTPYVGLATPLLAYPNRFCYLPGLAMVGVVGCGLTELARRWPRSRSALAGLAGGALLWLSAVTLADGVPYLKATEAVRMVLGAFDSFELQPRTTYVVWGVPDSVDGAYVFRNGLPQAIRLERGRGDIFVTTAERFQGGSFEGLRLTGDLRVERLGPGTR